MAKYLDKDGLTYLWQKITAAFKPKQTAVSDPTAAGSASSFIATISQDADGVITATKKNLPTVVSVQYYGSSNNTYPALCSYSASPSANSPSYVRFCSSITMNPSTGLLSATRMNATNGFFQTSDIRKKNVLGEIDLDKAYELVDKCSEILYILKSDDTNREQIGMIAQEVQQFFPEIVSTSADGTLSLDYSRLTVVILRVLKDLIKRIKKLEDK